MDIPKELHSDLETRRVLLFVGSGASLPASGTLGLPTGRQLAERIHSEILTGPFDPNTALQEVAQRAVWACGGSRAPLESLLSRIFADPAVKPQSHHEALAVLRLPVVTTNYDQLIEQAFRAKGVAASIIVDDADVPSATEPYLIKIHGCISRPNSCIISEEDYYRWLSSESELKNLLRALFTTLRVVFVGYSLADVNFRLLLSELRRKLGPALRRPYIVSPSPDPTSYNYEFVTHALGAHFIDSTAHAFLTSISEMYGRQFIPYADKYRGYYFQDPVASNSQAFVSYAATRLLEDLRSNTAGPLLLDKSVVDDVFVLAKPLDSEIYEPARSKLSPAGMVYVPAGEFIMGGSRLGNERLRVERIAKGFFIQEAAVSNKEYRAFAEYMRSANDHAKCHPMEPRHKNHWPETNFSGAAATDVIVTALPDDYFTNPEYDDYPVVNVDWWDAYAFAAWRGWRLSLEMEWEKAARGIDGRAFPYGNAFDASACNVAESGTHRTVRVRSHPAGRSPYGCFEMSGNVWEWCADLFHASEPEASPTRVLRGGSSTRGRVKAGAAFRNGRHVADRWIARGFRCVLSEDDWKRSQ